MSRSWTITEGTEIMSRSAIHPGEQLAEELAELGLSATELARQLDVPGDRIVAIVERRRAITADMALRLGHWFGVNPQFWLNLQQLHDLRIAERRAGKRIAELPRRVA
jgi:antitoxin HigA-1